VQSEPSNVRPAENNLPNRFTLTTQIETSVITGINSPKIDTGYRHVPSVAQLRQADDAAVSDRRNRAAYENYVQSVRAEGRPLPSDIPTSDPTEFAHVVSGTVFEVGK
jgi:hypothetical protein